MALEIYYGRLVDGVLKKSSTLIGQLATVHICDWLTKVEQIYEPSCLLFHGKSPLVSYKCRFDKKL